MTDNFLLNDISFSRRKFLQQALVLFLPSAIEYSNHKTQHHCKPQAS
jgi:hypothetical protein